jgi:hypothetical protein
MAIPPVSKILFQNDGNALPNTVTPGSGVAKPSVWVSKL